MKGKVFMEDWQDDILHAQWSLGRYDVFGDNFLYFETEAYVAARTKTFCEFAYLRRDAFWKVMARWNRSNQMSGVSPVR